MSCTHIKPAILIVFVTKILGFPTPSNLSTPNVPPAKVLDFLQKFGYIEKDDPNFGALYTEEGIAETIKVVQRFGALEETGVLNNKTLELMSSRRCGVPDVIKRKRSKRFIIYGDGWNKRTISYYIANWTPKLGEESVSKNIQLALDAWGKYGHLKFRKSPTPDADIIVAFGTYYHGDAFAFDGEGGVLAHAFFPNEDSSFAGDIHFDADENWSDKNNEEDDGLDFATVALHELGHSLGLSHSPIRNSIMFPYYQGFDPSNKFQIGYDDILGMYELYIRRNIPEDNATLSYSTQEPNPSTQASDHSTISTSEIFASTSEMVTDEDDYESVNTHKGDAPSTDSPSLPNICDGNFDAVASLRNELFVFKDQYVWRLRNIGKPEPGYPITIYQMFPELPKTTKRIDAAYQRLDGIIVLITGQVFWAYDGQNFVENSPRPLSEYGLPENLDGVDAVQVWAKNRKTYFYKSDRFWRYNETSAKMDEGYPKHMDRWRGVPQNLDAATTWQGVTYFFKGILYWKFDNDWVIVTEQSPLPAPHLWLGCPEDEKLLELYGS